MRGAFRREFALANNSRLIFLRVPNKTCHAEERSDEASRSAAKSETLRCAQGDIAWVLLDVLSS